MINSLSDSGLHKMKTPRAETAETAKTPGSAPGHVRILLGESESAALTAAGESVFMVIGRASHPTDPCRWVLHAVPVPMATANAACNVALGTHRAVKIKSDTAA